MAKSELVSSPLITVVVIGRNEGARLTRCLQSVQAMRDPGGSVEIIYVDSASRDDSVARARELGAQVIEVLPERPSAALGRNAGWRGAHAPYVLFLDGDTILHPDFVFAALQAMQDPEVAVVWGHRREIHPEQSLFNRVLDLDWIYPPGVSDFCGGDALMRTEVLRTVDGFDATLIADEEPELCQRIRALGYQILHIDQPMTGHDLAMTNWSSYWKRAFRAGHAYAEVSHRQRDTDFPLWVEDARRNRIRGGGVLLLLIAALSSVVLGQSFMPLLVVFGVILSLAVRSAWKARWKGGSPFTMFLYGLHSHAQQIPILFGQVAWWRDRRGDTIRRLIEYK